MQFTIVYGLNDFCFRKEWHRMIDIYTEKNSKEWILQNDLYFNLNTSNEEMSEKEIDIIRQVDEVG